MADTTKRLLVQSLKNQLKKKSLGKITISDITSGAGVNRMTFYYHFHDIYELVEWAFRDEIFNISTLKNSPITNWREGVLDVFRLLQKNQVFILNVYRSISREQVETHLLRALDEVVGHALTEQLERAGIPPTEQPFILRFYVYGSTGIILAWMEHGMKEDPTVIVDRYSRLVRSTLRGIFETYPDLSTEDKPDA